MNDKPHQETRAGGPPTRMLPLALLLTLGMAACAVGGAGAATGAAAPAACPDPAVVARAAVPGPAHLYVDGKSGHDYPAGVAACGSLASPCQNPWRALQLAGPGTTIHLMPTVEYTAPIYIAAMMGSPGRPITLQGDGVAPNRTRLRVSAANAIMIDGLPAGPLDRRPIAPSCAAYWTLRNLDIQATGNSHHSPHNAIAVVNAHHIAIENNHVHDSAASGIGTHWSDWLKITGNTVTGNAYDVSGATYSSGISLYQNKDFGSAAGAKIEIANNLVSGNANTCAAQGCQTVDGNGIIIDDSRQTQNFAEFAPEHRLPPYTGLTRIHHNVVERNGGRGIHLFSSENVQVHDNYVHHNQTDPKTGARHQGDIMAVESGGFSILNNIAVSDGLRVASDPGRSHYPISIINQSFIGQPSLVDGNQHWDGPVTPELGIYVDSIGAATGLLQMGAGNENRKPRSKR